MGSKRWRRLMACGRIVRVDGEDGFVLVLAMCILVVLSFIGLSVSNITDTDLQVAGNDRLHKETFYQADSGTELGWLLAYYNAICIQVNSADNGFAPTNPAGTKRTFPNNQIVSNITFAEPHALAGAVSDTNRDVAYYPGGSVNDAKPHTNLLYNVTQGAAAGSGLQMVSGYEGPLGVSATTGVKRNYDIYSQHKGVRNSESVITLGWQLSLGIVNSASLSDCPSTDFR